VQSIVLDMKNHNELKYISFNLQTDNDIKEDEIEMLGNVSYNKEAGHVLHGIRYTYSKSSMWTDNNYIVTTKYLKNLLKTLVYKKKVHWPEWVTKEKIYNVRKRYIWRKFGTWRFGAPGHNKTLAHLDGKKSKSCV
jgi:hypothetical protein